MDDKKIIELYFERSQQAISETSKKYGGYCHYIAYGILKSNEDSEECVNDAYLRAWNAIPPNRPNNLQTYLGKIVRNLSLNRLEKLSAEKRGATEQAVILDELAECIPSGENVQKSVEDTVISDAINRFLAGLSKDTRRIFVRRYWYMNSVKEIADSLCIGESKVAVTLFRTRQKLKKALLKEGIDL